MDAEERQLSERERTVLLLAAEGLTDKEIAKHLNLSQRTIGTYWERMRQKQGPFSRTQLVAQFLRSEVDSGGDGESYKVVFSAWDDGIWILSPTAETLYSNSGLGTLFGRSDAAQTIPYVQSVLESALGIVLSELLLQAAENPVRADFRYLRPDGTIVWIGLRSSAMSNPKSHAEAIVLRFHDVTLQHRVRNTLDSCESSLSFLADHSSDLIARFDSDLRCIAVNPTFLTLAKTSLDQVIGRKVEELSAMFKPNTRWIRMLEKALAAGEPQSFFCDVLSIKNELETHLLPEPSLDFLPQTIMSITTLKSFQTPEIK